MRTRLPSSAPAGMRTVTGAPAWPLRVQLERRAAQGRREVDGDLALEVGALGRPALRAGARPMMSPKRSPKPPGLPLRAFAEEVFQVDRLRAG